MKVQSVFLSVQGEAKEIGLPTVFVRFQGCNLNCSYCDTKYARSSSDVSTVLNPKELVEKIEKVGGWTKRVCLTGGEPLFQNQGELWDVIYMLRKKDYYISIETNGSFRFTLFVSDSFHVSSVVMDWKLPSSGMMKYMIRENLKGLRLQDQLKFVVADEKDFKYSLKVVRSLTSDPDIIYSPVFGKMKPKRLVELILKNKVRARMQLQLHKLIWPPDKRDV